MVRDRPGFSSYEEDVVAGHADEHLERADDVEGGETLVRARAICMVRSSQHQGVSAITRL